MPSQFAVIIGAGNGLAPSYHLKNFPVSIGPLETKFNKIRNLNTYFFLNAFENVICKMATILFSLNVLKENISQKFSTHRWENQENSKLSDS